MQDRIFYRRHYGLLPTRTARERQESVQAGNALEGLWGKLGKQGSCIAAKFIDIDFPTIITMLASPHGRQSILQFRAFLRKQLHAGSLL